MILKINKVFGSILQNKKIQIGLIFCLALGIRLYGIRFGLPFLYDPDELTFVSRAVQILMTQDLNPHWFGHPGTTTIYLLSFLYGLFYSAGKFIGRFEHLHDFFVFYNHDPTIFYLSGRILIAVFGAASILILIWVVRKIFNDRIALVSGLIFAVSPLHVAYSKLIRTDIQLTFWILLSFGFCLLIVEKGRWRDYLLAGFFAGIAVATKYPAVWITLILAMAHWMRVRNLWKEIHKLIGSAGASLLGAFMGSPFMFLDFDTVLRNTKYESRSVQLSHTSLGLWSNLTWYIQSPLVDTLTRVGIFLALLGLIIMLTSHADKKILLASFPILYLIFISTLHLFWSRWVIPVIPFLIVSSIFALDWIVEHLRKWIPPRYALKVFWVAALILLIPLLNRSILDGRVLSAPDTRTLAQNWILNNIPEDSRLLSEVFTPQMPAKQYQNYYAVADGKIEVYDPSSTYRSNYMPTGKIGYIDHPEKILQNQVQYIILSNQYDLYLAEEDRYPEIVENYNQIIQLGKLIYEIEPVPNQNQGPHIRIYQVLY